MKTLHEVLTILKNNESSIHAFKKNLKFVKIRLYRNGDKLHFIITDKDPEKSDALHRRVTLKKYFEQLTNCEVEIDIFNNIRDTFKESYIENSISFRKSAKNIEKFFPPETRFKTIESNSVTEITKLLRDSSIEEKEHKTETETERTMRQEKWTPLFMEIYHGNIENVKQMIISDKDSIKHRDRLGHNAYLLAAAYGNIEIFDWLTENVETLNLDKNEISLDARCSEGFTPFLAASYANEVDFMDYLIKKYPDKKQDFLTQVDRFGKNARLIAKFYKNENAVTYLKSLENTNSLENASSATIMGISSSAPQGFFNNNLQSADSSTNASSNIPKLQ